MTDLSSHIELKWKEESPTESEKEKEKNKTYKSIPIQNNTKANTVVKDPHTKFQQASCLAG